MTGPNEKPKEKWSQGELIAELERLEAVAEALAGDMSDIVGRMHTNSDAIRETAAILHRHKNRHK